MLQSILTSFGTVRPLAVIALMLYSLLFWSRPASAEAPHPELPELLVARLHLMDEIAAAKWHAGQPIEDTIREAAVLEQAALDGLAYNLDTRRVRALFEAQIQAAKQIQAHWFQRWRDGVPVPAAPDLGVTRPALLTLGERILAAWAEADAVPTPAAVRSALDAVEGLDEGSIAALVDALQQRDSYPDALTRIRSSGVLRVGTTGDYPPFSARLDSGERVGIDIDLARDLASRLGVAVVFVETSWPGLRSDHLARRFDIAMSGISITAEREQFATFSQAYHRGGKAAIARCENLHRLDSLSKIDQPTTRVIVNPGGTNERFVRTVLHQAQIIMHPDNRTIFDALIAGKADVMLTDLIEVQLQAHRHTTLCAAISTPLNTQHKGIMMVTDSPLNETIDAWLSDQLRTGKVAQLIDHHIAADKQETP